MLKIKDNVDLKELEKFGAVKKGSYYIEDETGNCAIRICKTRRITFSGRRYTETICNMLYDLIQAGLVEKK